MSLIQLYNPLENDEDIARFVSENYNDHLVILSSILSSRQINIPLLDIRSLDSQNQGIWALNHQALHNSTNAVFKIPGSDFTQINFQDKQQLESVKRLHAEEHRQWHNALGLG